MNAPVNADLHAALARVSLDDKYTLSEGRAFMSGTQALVRLPMLQQARDHTAGLQTAGFISGYRGSPLGALDQALWQARAHLDAHCITFQPGVNEDLAATSIWGSQQLALDDRAVHDGVFGMWYGKGPGVDRSMDALKHANNAGTAPHGGVLALAGDDHAAQSSTVAYQSEHNFISAGIPVLYPATVQEYLEYGLHGWAMSRYTGLWIAMKCVTEIVETSASVVLNPSHPAPAIPSGHPLPPDGLNIRLPDNALAQETRLLEHKLPAALAYIRHNRLNQMIIDPPRARMGIVAAGKAWLDTRQALANLGIDDAACIQVGIRLIKMGCVWPVPTEGIHTFAAGLDTLLIIEEKRPLLETAFKEALYPWPDHERPRVLGKQNVAGYPVALPSDGQLSAELIAPVIAQALDTHDMAPPLASRIHAHLEQIKARQHAHAGTPAEPGRLPWFCSGCPHNTSTRVPEGSRTMAGIGCHFMATWMDRNAETFSQMGGEGAAWIGQQPFTTENHVFANLGDGTYFHSGVLAIRASIAAKVNITYKILYNDAVAMTGGQPVDGVLTVPQLVSQMHAEGARKIVVVTDDLQPYRQVRLTGSAAVHHRDELDRIQRELRDTPGTTILIYDQTCATEKRRRRKRGTYPDPARRIFINPSVCEGCGDCSVKSNCLSVEPLETLRGTKRQINQSTCNKDFSCIKGFCPSFVMAEGAQLRSPDPRPDDHTPAPQQPLPTPALPSIDDTFGILITGVGGTGVVTLGSVLGMAAHLEGKAVSVLDMAGLAQKGGAVFSHVKMADAPARLHATRISAGQANLVLGCDSLVTAGRNATELMRPEHTHAVVNSAKTPTAAMIGDAKWAFPVQRSQQAIRKATSPDHASFLDASALARAWLGDSIYANPLLLGFAWQRGQLPLAHASLMRAIELNGVKVEENLQAFAWGRRLACQPELADITLQTDARTDDADASQLSSATLDDLIAHHSQWLTDYQDASYAKRYTDAVARIRTTESALAADDSLKLTRAVAANLAKLMAYKDEYEVARLYTEPAFLDALRAQFDGEPGKDYQLNFYLAPPMLAQRDTNGELVKRRFGPRTMHAFKILARLKGLRGTMFDPFGKTAERRQERALIQAYFAMLDEFSSTLTADRLETAITLASLPDSIRGFGHVKEKNLQAAQARYRLLMEQYHHAAAPAQAVA